MSAFICSEFHIKIIACAMQADLIGYPKQQIKIQYNAIELSKIANILNRANYKSVNVRYPNNKEKYQKLSITFDDCAKIEEYINNSSNPYLLIMKLATCYAYQSCEFDSWDRSKAKKLIDKLYLTYAYSITISHPEYNKLPWAVA
jgi:hypothetical protein